MIKKKTKLTFLLVTLVGFLGFSSTQGATATWTNTANNASGFWTSSANWNAASYPGSGVGETANLNTSTAATYTCILNATLGQSLSVLSVNNANAAGQAWLVLTNATLTASTVNLGNGGRLQIDNNGVLTNVNSLAWTGTNGVVYLNSGGNLFTTNTFSIAQAANNIRALIAGTGGLWNFASNVLEMGYSSGNGSPSSMNSLWVDSGSVLTNVGVIKIGISGTGSSNGSTRSNLLTIAGGSQLFGTGTNLAIGGGGTYAAAISNGMVIVGSGSIVTNIGAITLGGNGAPSGVDHGNYLTITNGASLYSGGLVGILGRTGGDYASVFGVPAAPSLWDFGGSALAIGSSGSVGSYLLVNGGGGTGGAVVTNIGAITIGNGAGSSSYLTITNAGKVFSSGVAIVGNGCPMNQGFLVGASTWNLGSNMLEVGHSSANASPAYTNSLWVDTGSVLTNVGVITVGISGTGTGNGGTLNNLLTIAGGSQLFGTGTNLAIGGGGANASATGNGMVIAGGGSVVTNIGAITLGGNGTANIVLRDDSNYLTITNGASLYSGGPVSILGHSGGDYAAVFGVPAAPSLWNFGGSTLAIGSSASVGSYLLVNGGGGTGGAVVTNIGAITIGNGAGSSSYLTITNAGKVFNSGVAIVGYGCSRNQALVVGASEWDLGLNILDVGYSPANPNPANTNSLRVDTGSVLKNVGVINIGLGGSSHGIAYNNVLTIAGGSKLFGTGSNVTISTGPSSFGFGCSNGMVVAGSGSVATNLGAITIGAGLISGQNYGNYLTITNGGMVYCTSIAMGFGNAAGNGNNTVLVDAGVLEANSLTLGSTVGNVISNSGGIFQFTTNTPAISAAGGSSAVAINSGTISFRNVIGVDVKTNWSGTSLTRMSFTGTNAFRLDAATNATTPDQTYTFATGLGATNYTRLELLNGSLYRGGNVTIGANGTLLVSNGVSTVSGTLTFDPTATLSVDLSKTSGYGALVAQGAVDLGGCTLNINLGTAPVPGSSFNIISTSPGSTTHSFSAASQVQTLNGTNYLLRVHTSTSGATVTCNLLTQGMCLIIE